MATQDSGVVDDKDLAQAEQYAARWLKIIQDPNFRASEDPQWLVRPFFLFWLFNWFALN